MFCCVSTPLVTLIINLPDPKISLYHQLVAVTSGACNVLLRPISKATPLVNLSSKLCDGMLGSLISLHTLLRDS
jgi:hypothetical protein